MDMLTTDRTYASRDNAVKALGIAAAKLGKSIVDIRYIVATNDAGRFAPVVVGLKDMSGDTNNGFPFIGVTWVA